MTLDRFRKPVFFGLLLAFAAFISLVHLFDRYELLSYDLRLQLRPRQPVSEHVAIVEIDDLSLQRLNQWPIPRDFHASLVDVLTEIGAAGIVFDVMFTDPAPEDEVFADSIKKSGRVYLPQVFYVQGNLDPVEVLHTRVPVLAPVTKTLKQADPKSGHINVTTDLDGKTRRTVLYIREQNNFVAQIGLQAACDFLKINCNQVRRLENNVLIGGRLNIPVNNFNEIMVNYPGTWENSFERFSYVDVLKNYQDWKQGKPMGRLAKLKGRVCFVGLTAAGTVDLRSMPMENIYPMVGLQASMFNSVVERQFIQRLPAFWNAVTVMMILAICLVMGLQSTPLFSFLGSMLLALGYTLWSTTLINKYGVWVDLFWPLTVIVMAYLGCISVRWLRELQMRKVLEKEMSVAAEIQEQFLVTKGLESIDATIVTWFSPAKFVAGDLYEVFKIDEKRTGMLLGDVSGKGLAASLLMAQAISLFRIFSRLKTSAPNEILQNLNHELGGRFPGRFVTAVYCIADKEQGHVEISSAGQGSLLVCRRPEGKVEELEVLGAVPLGIMPDSEYESTAFRLKPDDLLILASDGVYEAHNAEGQEWGMENFKKTIEQNAGKSLAEILECIKASIGEFTAGEQHFDDITLIIFSFRK